MKNKVRFYLLRESRNLLDSFHMEHSKIRKDMSTKDRDSRIKQEESAIANAFQSQKNQNLTTQLYVCGSSSKEEVKLRLMRRAGLRLQLIVKEWLHFQFLNWIANNRLVELYSCVIRHEVVIDCLFIYNVFPLVFISLSIPSDNIITDE